MKIDANARYKSFIESEKLAVRRASINVIFVSRNALERLKLIFRGFPVRRFKYWEDVDLIGHYRGLGWPSWTGPHTWAAWWCARHVLEDGYHLVSVDFEVSKQGRARASAGAVTT